MKKNKQIICDQYEFDDESKKEKLQEKKNKKPRQSTNEKKVIKTKSKPKNALFFDDKDEYEFITTNTSGNVAANFMRVAFPNENRTLIK